MSQQLHVNVSRDTKPSEADLDAVRWAIVRYQEYDQPWTGEFIGVPEFEIFTRTSFTLSKFKELMAYLICKDPRVQLVGPGMYQFTWHIKEEPH